MSQSPRRRPAPAADKFVASVQEEPDDEAEDEADFQLMGDDDGAEPVDEEELVKQRHLRAAKVRACVEFLFLQLFLHLSAHAC